MSYDNNNFYNDDLSENTWQGNTWDPTSQIENTNNTMRETFNDTFESANPYGYNYRPEPVTPQKALSVGFEENVLAQSFAFMFVALLITAFTAYYVVSSPVIFYKIFYTPNAVLMLCIAELVVVFAANFTLARNMLVPSAVLFTLYSVINGATLSCIFVIYELGSIYTTFAICAVMFGVMSVYGIVTKRDLTSLGSLALTALIGLIIAGVANWFIGSSMLDMVVSGVGIIVFVGLIAYDAQKIKDMINYTDSDNITCIALMGALELYLDFINLFLKLLRFFGRRNK